MGHPSMACILVVALVLPELIHGRPATDDGGSVLNMLESRVSKPEDFSEPKAISSIVVQEDLSIPVKSRQKRLSDQRRAELETRAKIEGLIIDKNSYNKRSLTTRRSKVDLMKIGRRRRFAVDPAPASIKTKYIGDPAYPLIS